MWAVLGAQSFVVWMALQAHDELVCDFLEAIADWVWSEIPRLNWGR